MPPVHRESALPPPRGAFVLSRIRRSIVLKACGMLAFVEYGALLVWGVFGKVHGQPEAIPRTGRWFPMAGWLAVCSLASWFFLFLWYPFLQSLNGKDNGDGSALRLGRILEAFAIGCVAVVHVMLLLILIEATRH
jgi:hypothetical protein